MSDNEYTGISVEVRIYNQGSDSGSDVRSFPNANSFKIGKQEDMYPGSLSILEDDFIVALYPAGYYHAVWYTEATEEV